MIKLLFLKYYQAISIYQDYLLWNYLTYLGILSCYLLWNYLSWKYALLYLMELSILQTSLAIFMNYFIFEVCLTIFYEIIYHGSIHTLLSTYNGIFYLWSKPCYLEVLLATFHVIIYLGSLPCYLFGIFYLGKISCYLLWNYLSYLEVSLAI